MTYKILFAISVICFAGLNSYGQQPPETVDWSCKFGTGTTPGWAGLTAGKSTKDDVERVLGQPINKISETLVEYKAHYPITNVYVQYRKGSGLVDRLELWLVDPWSDPRPDLSGIEPDVARYSGAADANKVNAKGKLERYFGAPEYLVLNYLNAKTEEEAFAPIRIAFYSPELFESIVPFLPPTGLRKYGRDVSNSVPFVQSVQNALTKLGHFGGVADGKLTLATRVALRSFQRSRNMRCYGDVDERTVQALALTPPKPGNQ